MLRFLFCTFLTLGFFESFAAAQSPFEKTKPLRVGFIISLSGDGAALGEALKNGFELGLEKVSPETRAKMDIKFEDDGLVTKNTLSAFQKLMASGGLDAVVSFSSGTSKALAPLTEPKGITLLAIASDFNVVKGRDYAFNFWVTPDIATTELIKEVEKRGYKTLARINSIHDGVFAYKQAFDAQNAGRFNIVLDEDYPPDVKNFKPYLTKLRAKKDVDALFVVLLPGQIGPFAKQARQFGFTKDLFGVELFEDPNEVKASDNALLNQWYVNNDEPDPSFSKQYAERFPQASTYASANGHDLALLFATAIETGYKGESLNKFFKSLKDFKGALGTYSATGDQRFTLPATIKVVREGRFEKLYPK